MGRTFLCTLLLSATLSACAGGAAHTRDPITSQCGGQDAFVQLGQSFSTILKIIEGNPTDPDQAAAEINAYADERQAVTSCLRAVVPDLNARMDSDPALLKSYARTLGPAMQRHDALKVRMPEMFQHPGVLSAMKRLL